MQRIATATKATDLFGAGKHGFKDGNLGLGILPTDFEADYCNDLQEELMAIIEGAGVAPNTAVVTQVLQAIKRLCGGNITTVNFAASPFNLTADHAGLVLIDATAGNVLVNLPAANVLTAVPIEFDFVRVDGTANTATVDGAGAETIGGAANFTLVGQYSNRTIRSNAVDAWLVLAQSAAAVSEAYVYLRDQKASGTGPGTAAVGWQTRTLNTEVSDASGVATLAANQITLSAGTYKVWARAPGYQVDQSKLRLRNVTAGTTLLVGNSGFDDSLDGTAASVFVVGRITVAASQVLELQHYCSRAGTLGNASISGEVEVYAEITFAKELS